MPPNRGPGACPFVGLRAFSYHDREWFFGRESQIADLVEKVASSRLISVIGNSGSGKSSLIRAGLLPRLSETSDDPEANWNWVAMRPGEAPIRFLAEAMARPNQMVEGQTADPVIEGRANRIEIALRESSFGIREALPFAGMQKKLIILIDQFEEIFRFADLRAQLATDPLRAQEQRDEATLFIQLLLTATSDPEFSGRIVITMRSDFIGDCARFHGLSAAVTKSQYLVPALTRDQRAEVIRQPMELSGGSVDPALVQRLLNDTNEDNDQLPVLQHAMMRMWMHATKNGATRTPNLSLDDYTAVGGIEHAISRHADEVLDTVMAEPAVSELPYLEYSHVTKRVFQSLTDTDALGRTIRRPQKFGELLAVLTEDTAGKDEKRLAAQVARTVVLRFCDPSCSFLRLPEEKDLNDATVVDIGHEAFIRKWSRLGEINEKNWVREEQEDAERLNSLTAFAKRGVPLPADQLSGEEAWWKERRPNRAWVQRYRRDGARLLAEVGELLRNSRAEIELRDNQRMRRVRQKWSVVVSIIALIIVGVAVVAKQQSDAKDMARENLYVALGTAALVTDGPGKALLIALETRDEKLPFGPGVEGLIYAALERPREISVADAHGNFPPLIVFMPDGSLFSYSDKLSKWDPTTGTKDASRQDTKIEEAKGNAESAGNKPVQFFDMRASGDGKSLLLWNLDDTYIVDASSGQFAKLGDKENPDTHAGFAAFSPEGDGTPKFILTASRASNASPKIWALDTSVGTVPPTYGPKPLVDLKKVDKELQAGSAVTFGTRYFAIADLKGVIHVFSADDLKSDHFDPTNLRPIKILDPALYPTELQHVTSTNIQAVEFNPKNPDQLLSIMGGIGILWNVGSSEPKELPNQSRVNFRGAFSPDGSRMALRSSDGSAVVWDLAHLDAKPTKVVGAHGFGSVVFSRGEPPYRIAAGGEQGAIWTWSLDPVLADGAAEKSGSLRDETALVKLVNDSLRMENGKRVSEESVCLDKIGTIRLSEINPAFKSPQSRDSIAKACKERSETP